jgi:hypothetical protein
LRNVKTAIISTLLIHILFPKRLGVPVAVVGRLEEVLPVVVEALVADPQEAEALGEDGNL